MTHKIIRNFLGRENYFLQESARARHIRITIKRDGKVIITKPRRAPLGLVEKFVREKSAWIEKKVAFMKSRPEKIFAKPSWREFLAGKNRALALVKDKVKKWNAFYNFKYNKVSIRNVSSRFGSCSRQGNLNFSFVLLNMPEEAVDYVVVHELCHLAEMNHGPRFWALVARTIPDYKKIGRLIKNIE